jgi:hypothetical protein
MSLSSGWISVCFVLLDPFFLSFKVQGQQHEAEKKWLQTYASECFAVCLFVDMLSLLCAFSRMPFFRFSQLLVVQMQEIRSTSKESIHPSPNVQLNPNPAKKQR